MRALFQILMGVATRPGPSRAAPSRTPREGGSGAGRTADCVPATGLRAACRTSSNAIGASTSTNCQSIWNRRTIFQTRRGSAEKTNGEKRQMASFGQSSRSPPPAKPQPTANGSACPSDTISGGQLGQGPRPSRRRTARRQAGEKRPFERQVRRVVARAGCRAATPARRAECRVKTRESPGRGSPGARRSGCGGTGDTAPASWPAPP